MPYAFATYMFHSQYPYDRDALLGRLLPFTHRRNDVRMLRREASKYMSLLQRDPKRKHAEIGGGGGGGGGGDVSVMAPLPQRGRQQQSRKAYPAAAPQMPSFSNSVDEIDDEDL